MVQCDWCMELYHSPCERVLSSIYTYGSQWTPINIIILQVALQIYNMFVTPTLSVMHMLCTIMNLKKLCQLETCTNNINSETLIE